MSEKAGKGGVFKRNWIKSAGGVFAPPTVVTDMEKAREKAQQAPGPPKRTIGRFTKRARVRGGRRPMPRMHGKHSFGVRQHLRHVGPKAKSRKVEKARRKARARNR